MVGLLGLFRSPFSAFSYLLKKPVYPAQPKPNKVFPYSVALEGVSLTFNRDAWSDTVTIEGGPNHCTGSYYTGLILHSVRKAPDIRVVLDYSRIAPVSSEDLSHFNIDMSTMAGIIQIRRGLVHNQPLTVIANGRLETILRTSLIDFIDVQRPSPVSASLPAA